MTQAAIVCKFGFLKLFKESQGVRLDKWVLADHFLDLINFFQQIQI